MFDDIDDLIINGGDTKEWRNFRKKYRSNWKEYRKMFKKKGGAQSLLSRDEKIKKEIELDEKEIEERI